MPAYINSPSQNPKLLLKGVPVYLLGSFDYKVGNSKNYVSNVAITTNVATVTITNIDGPKPVIGNYISIIGTTTGAGEFNVNRAVITGVTWTDSTGSGTVTFALTGANVGTTTDSGTAIVEPAEVGETVSGSVNTQACVVQAPDGDSQFTLPLAVLAASGVTAMTATLQVALKNIDSEYTNTTTVVTKTGATTYTAGPVVQATLQRGYCYRIAITAVTGSGSVIAKIG